jgi:AcrB/AcrD/AcrF family
LIPSVTIPFSLLSTCVVMYLVGYTIDNVSLMALTIAVGFIIDDAVVMVEKRHAPYRSGRAPAAGGPDRIAGDRFHYSVHDVFVDSGVPAVAVRGPSHVDQHDIAHIASQGLFAMGYRGLANDLKDRDAVVRAIEANIAASARLAEH